MNSQDPVLGVFSQKKPIFIDITGGDGDSDDPNSADDLRIYLRRLDPSKIWKYWDVATVFPFTGGYSAEPCFLRCGSTGDLFPGMREVWDRMNSDSRSLFGGHLDVESGRMFLSFSDGIRVFHYV